MNHVHEQKMIFNQKKNLRGKEKKKVDTEKMRNASANNIKRNAGGGGSCLSGLMPLISLIFTHQ